MTRRHRPPIPVTLVLPTESPSEEEVDAIAWFPHEVRKIRQAINRTLQRLGQATMSDGEAQHRYTDACRTQSVYPCANPSQACHDNPPDSDLTDSTDCQRRNPRRATAKEG